VSNEQDEDKATQEPLLVVAWYAQRLRDALSHKPFCSRRERRCALFCAVVLIGIVFLLVIADTISIVLAYLL
jgi:hypothetical protein